eukprot:COSAG02_NODE_49506_length_326_cov_0.916300_1_plen_39_part_10
MLFNTVASTSTHMQETLETAASSLASFEQRLAAAVKLHT